MNEDFQLILDYFLKCLQETRDYQNLKSLEYQKEGENRYIVATYSSGRISKVNVTGDSGSAMIRDFMNAS